MNIVFPGNTRRIPEVMIIAFPNIDRVASLGIGTPSRGRYYRPWESSHGRDGSLNRDYVDANIVARDHLGREGIALEGMGHSALQKGGKYTLLKRRGYALWK